MMRFIRSSKRTGEVEWYAARGQRPMCMSNDRLDSMPPVAGCGTEPALIIVNSCFPSTPAEPASPRRDQPSLDDFDLAFSSFDTGITKIDGLPLP